MIAEQLLTMFFNDTVYSFERSDEHSSFIFGGPFESQRFSGVPTGVRPLHLVACLRLMELRELESRSRFFRLPLIYGFSYDGCEIKYKIKPTGWIEILTLWPTESSDDFPYENYPFYLPYAPLRLSERRSCEYSEFADGIPNMVEEQPAELIIAVPPPATLGVSLWGPSGDADCATVVFECDLSERTVRAYNRCIA
jgi:hypothetical protein